ncbi:hypothetical protein [Streptomyces sp. SJL17-1]|uniref:hypothetical protein n=1 Tax=Streptomyces sp. SJL17-1 TaxID=2967223 RepID=UPI00398FBACC
MIESVAGATTVLPLRLATVYLDDDRAREALDAAAPDSYSCWRGSRDRSSGASRSTWTPPRSPPGRRGPRRRDRRRGSRSGPLVPAHPAGRSGAAASGRTRPARTAAGDRGRGPRVRHRPGTPPGPAGRTGRFRRRERRERRLSAAGGPFARVPRRGGAGPRTRPAPEYRVEAGPWVPYSFTAPPDDLSGAPDIRCAGRRGARRDRARGPRSGEPLPQRQVALIDLLDRLLQRRGGDHR